MSAFYRPESAPFHVKVNQFDLRQPVFVRLATSHEMRGGGEKERVDACVCTCVGEREREKCITNYIKPVSPGLNGNY